MGKWISIGLIAALLATVIPPGTDSRTYAADGDNQIILDESMVTALTVHQAFRVERMVDEQTAETIVTANNNNSVTFNHGSATFPAHAYIDLGAPYDISRISTMSGASPRGVLELSAGKPDNWTSLYQDDMTQRAVNSWYDHEPDEPIRTRYLLVSMLENTTLREIRLYGEQVPTDVTPPAAVADLTAAAASTAVTLSWTAPGNDGDVGTAARYDIRYSKEPIADADWDQALPIEDIPQPLEAGTAQQAFVYALEPQTVYYFALKSYDDWQWEEPNQSELSNVAMTTTGEDTLPPGQIDDLALFSAGSRTATLTWTATGNDGIHGIANAYDVRYSEQPLTEDNWGQATPAVDLPVPSPSGAAESAVVTGLVAETVYYMGIKAIDASGNASPLSNVIQLTTAETDLIPPGPIGDFSAAVDGNAVTFSWIAPGDDGDEGTATLYDIRYLAEPITEDNWNEALLVGGAPQPAVAGTLQSFTEDDLPRGRYLYVAMKAYDEDDNVSPLSANAKFGFAAKIVLDPSMVIDETGLASYAGALVDEQELVGEPRLGPISQTGEPEPLSDWNFPYNRAWLQGPTAVIDLGAEYDLTEFVFFKAARMSDMTVYTGEPFEWVERISKPTGGSKNWISAPLNASTRYVRVHFDNGGETTPAFPPIEIVLYGIADGERQPEPEPVPHDYAAMDEFVGINAFIDDPFDRLAVAGNIREYHNWRWDEVGVMQYPNNVKSFNPSNAAGGNSWFFDDYYTMLTKMGIDVFPDIKETFDNEWFGNNINNKPVKVGDDPLLPQSYEMIADHMFQYAARYGGTQVDDGLLKLRDNQERLSGLGLIKYLEVGNEQDQDWNGRGAFFTPLEYAAMASAVYDGHAGTMGDTFGMKNADPDMKFAMAGLAGIEIDYVRAMKFWSDYNRPDGKFPADVINFHHYSNSRGDQHQTPDTKGISPEEDRLFDRASAMTDYRNRYLPGVEVWASEFGYDTNPNSTQGVPLIGTFTREEVQGQWLLRSLLIYAAAGVDRAQIYMLRDAGDAGNSTKYSTSGLVTNPESGQQKKVSWYYVYTLKNRLAGMRFVEELESGHPDVMIYKFASDDERIAYVLWSPTSTQNEVPDYKLHVGDGHAVMTQVTMADKETDGIQSYLQVDETGEVSLHVGETPMIVLEGEIPYNTPPAWEEGAAIELNLTGETSAEISWPEAEDDTGILYYSIMNGTELVRTVSADTTSHAFEIYGDRTNEISVVAADVTGKESLVPLTLEIKHKDEIPPTKPGNVQVLMTNSSQILLQWEPSTDNIGVAGYRIYGNDVLVGSASGEQTTFTVNGLSPGTTYAVTIEAYDEEGNVSERSEPAEARTEAGGGSGGSAGGYYPPADSGGLAAEESTSGSETIAVFDKSKLDREIDRLKDLPRHAQVIAYAADASAEAVRVSLPVSSLKHAAERIPDGKVEVRFATGTVALSVRELAAMAGDSSDGELSIGMSRGGTLPGGALAPGDVQRGESWRIDLALTADGTTGTLRTTAGPLGSALLRIGGIVDPGRLTVVRLDEERNELVFVPARFNPRTGEAELHLPAGGEYAVVQAERSFADMSGHWAEQDVKLLSSKLLVRGVGEDAFKPNAALSRAQFAAMLVRALGLSDPTDAEPAFADVRAADWFARDVAAAANAGLIAGKGDGTFRPNDEVSREEMAVMLLQALKLTGAPSGSGEHAAALSSLADKEAVAGWSTEAVAVAVETGLMQGKSGLAFEPRQAATRAEGAVVLKRLLQYIGFIN